MLNDGKIRASGTPHEIKLHTAESRVRVRTQTPVAQIEALPGVRAVTVDRGQLEISTSDSTELVRRLLELDSALSDLEVKTSGIEEAFLDLVGETAATQPTNDSKEVA